MDHVLSIICNRTICACDILDRVRALDKRYNISFTKKIQRLDSFCTWTTFRKYPETKRVVSQFEECYRVFRDRRPGTIKEDRMKNDGERTSNPGDSREKSLRGTRKRLTITRQDGFREE